MWWQHFQCKVSFHLFVSVNFGQNYCWQEATSQLGRNFGKGLPVPAQVYVVICLWGGNNFNAGINWSESRYSWVRQRCLCPTPRFLYWVRYLELWFGLEISTGLRAFAGTRKHPIPMIKTKHILCQFTGD